MCITIEYKGGYIMTFSHVSPQLFKQSPFSNTYADKYTPDMIRSAYNYTDKYGGDGITVAVVTAFANVHIENDVREFSSSFGLPEPNIEIVRTSQAVNPDAVWNREAALDVEWIHASAPKAKLVLITPNSAVLENLMECVLLAKEYSADIVSLSFGLQEKYVKSFYEDKLSDDIIYLAAAGDIPGVCLYPSSSPMFVGIGGTNLDIDKNGRRISEETAWENGGGGVSSVFSIPDYQNIFRPIAFMSQSMRAIPDASFFSSGSAGAAVYFTSQRLSESGWISAEGTSLGTPMWAGIAAMCLEASGKKLSGHDRFMRFLYALAGTTAYSNVGDDYIDIVSGGNGVFYATKGYDFCTGLGSPNVANIVSAAEKE